MMCSWSREQACFSSMRHRETLQSGIQHLTPRGSAGNCIPLNQGFHGHRNLNPESLTPCVSAHEQAAGRTLWPTAWLELCPTGFIPGLWPMLMDRVENQVDNLAPICSCLRKIRQGFQQGLQHKHNVPEAEGPCQLPTSSRGTAGSTGLSAGAGTTGTLQPQQHQGVWHQQQRLD